MLSCGCIVPFLAEACSPSRRPDSKMPVAEGKIFDKTVKVLRDAGCSTVFGPEGDRLFEGCD